MLPTCRYFVMALLGDLVEHPAAPGCPLMLESSSRLRRVAASSVTAVVGDNTCKLNLICGYHDAPEGPTSLARGGSPEK